MYGNMQMESWDEIHEDFRRFKRFVPLNKRPRNRPNKGSVRRMRRARQMEREMLTKEMEHQRNGH